MLYCEGELLLGIPPGVIARELIQNMQGKAHELLIDVSRDIIYRVADPTQTPPITSGLEYLIALMDTEYGKEKDEAESDAMTDWENWWREAGTDMKSFNSEEDKKYTEAQKHADLQVSNSYRAKRLVEHARITPEQKENLMSKVDASWSSFEGKSLLLSSNVRCE